MKKELITEESVEALVKEMSKEDRNALSMYTYMMMMAFAKKITTRLRLFLITLTHQVLQPSI